MALKIVKANLKWRRKLVPLDVSKRIDIAVHHMGHPTADIDEIHRWHLERGWNWKGFAYNYWTSFEGIVYEGRGLNKGGGLKYPHNSSVISLGFQGDYENANKAMPGEQYNAGVELINYLQSTLTIGRIDGHNYWNKTRCPGKFFPLEQMKSEVTCDIMDFQRRYRLVVDRIVGPNTKSTMKEVYEFIRPYMDKSIMSTIDIYSDGTHKIT